MESSFHCCTEGRKLFCFEKQKNILNETLEGHLTRKESDKVGLMKKSFFAGEKQNNWGKIKLKIYPGLSAVKKRKKVVQVIGLGATHFTPERLRIFSSIKFLLPQATTTGIRTQQNYCAISHPPAIIYSPLEV